MLGTWFVEPVLVNFVSVILVSIRFGVLTSFLFVVFLFAHDPTDDPSGSVRHNAEFG
jgi:hypothetical protein